MSQTPFSAFIRQRRLELGLSLKAASRRTGIQPSRLHDLETGISSTTGKPTGPSRENLDRLAQGYQLSLDYLLDLTGRPNLDAQSQEEKLLLSHFRALVPGHRSAVLALVDELYRLDVEERSK